MTTQVGQLVGAKYELVEKLGQGGFGTVYRARDQMLGRDVAIKLMKVDQEDRETAMQRFFAEARNTSRLVHPNNVRVFDFGHNDDGQVYLVMEYVTGQPLSKLPVPLDPHRMLHIGAQVARALDEAHELGIVHRDLKPDNVMIGQVDGREFARVLDYGIAKLENSKSGLTQTGGFIGTAEYAAPEQLRARGVDRRTDIYTFGVMLWSLIAGRPLFDAEDAISIAYMHVHETPGSLAEHAEVSDALNALVMKCLRKQPEERYASMGEVLAAIEAVPEFRTIGGATQASSSLGAQLATQPEATGAGPTMSEPAQVAAPARPTMESATIPVESLRRRRSGAALAIGLMLVAGAAAALVVAVVSGGGDEPDASDAAAAAEEQLAAPGAEPTLAPQVPSEADAGAIDAARRAGAELATPVSERAADVAAAGEDTAPQEEAEPREAPRRQAAQEAEPTSPTPSRPSPRATPTPARPVAAVPEPTPRRTAAPEPEEAPVERPAPVVAAPAPPPTPAPAAEAEPETEPETDTRSRRELLQETLRGESDDEPEPSRRDRLRNVIGE